MKVATAGPAVVNPAVIAVATVSVPNGVNAVAEIAAATVVVIVTNIATNRRA
jgi:hypothetical protein